ncbi:MAG: class I SAM-dependent methyltransferase [Atopobiaceae bacterium]|nr:class I SAM-dependent methyltransferase [Atopobiaceae bacterium]MCI1539707.1 class I SAM-dependent methyltransferase [Atopobiaceae bacterium]
MPILAAAGARCTVLDQSEAQLASERLVAEREGYDIEIVKADMTEGLPLEDASFDMVLNPVSLCYVRECAHLPRGCTRSGTRQHLPCGLRFRRLQLRRRRV